MSSLWIFVPRSTKNQSIIGGARQCSEEIHNLAPQMNRIGQNNNPTSIAVNWTFSAFFQGVSLSSNLNLLDKPFTYYIGLGTIPCSHLRCFPHFHTTLLGVEKAPEGTAWHSACPPLYVRIPTCLCHWRLWPRLTRCDVANAPQSWHRPYLQLHMRNLTCSLSSWCHTSPLRSVVSSYVVLRCANRCDLTIPSSQQKATDGISSIPSGKCTL